MVNASNLSDTPKAQQYIQLGRRLERAGANDVNVTGRPKFNFTVIDFKLIDTTASNRVFSSSVELEEPDRITTAQLRLPHIKPDPKPDTSETIEEARRRETQDLLFSLKQDIAEIIGNNTDIEVIEKAVQSDFVDIRPQDGFVTVSDRQNLTLHVTFETKPLGPGEREAEITPGEIVDVVRKITQLWNTKYFNVNTVPRSELDNNV